MNVKIPRIYQRVELPCARARAHERGTGTLHIPEIRNARDDVSEKRAEFLSSRELPRRARACRLIAPVRKTAGSPAINGE